MSENGEIYTAGKNFTLPLAVTAWTNSTSGDIMVAKTKGSLLCMYVWKCVYMDKHMLRASQVPGTPLSWVRPSSEKHPDGGEEGVCKNSMHMIEPYFHRHHISRAACIIILIDSKVHNNIVAEFVTMAINWFLEIFSSWLGSNLVNHFPRTYHGTSLHCLSGVQKQFLIGLMVKRPRSSVSKSQSSIVLVLESPSSLATTNPKFSLQGLLQMQTWQYSTHNKFEVTGMSGQSTF